MTAVVLAYGDEPWVERCVDALLASRGVVVDVVVVDNGCTTGAPDRLSRRPCVTVVRPGRNLGFAGGCNAGAALARGEYVALVNADALVDPDALQHLIDSLGRGVGVSTASVRLASDRSVINSAGNPVHFSGLSWSGGFGEPAERHSARRDVASASGAALVLRRELWTDLGGFAPQYFAYLEDAELSMRVWQRGLRVQYVPEAVVVHRYEFSRNRRKLFLLERNRLVWLLTLLERRTLLRAAPALLLVELCLVLMACAQGWMGAKAGGWVWLIRNRGWVAERRRQLQQERRVTDAALVSLLSGRLTMTNVETPPGFGLVDVVLAAWWSLVRWSLRRRQNGLRATRTNSL